MANDVGSSSKEEMAASWEDMKSLYNKVKSGTSAAASGIVEGAKGIKSTIDEGRTLTWEVPIPKGSRRDPLVLAPPKAPAVTPEGTAAPVAAAPAQDQPAAAQASPLSLDEQIAQKSGEFSSIGVSTETERPMTKNAMNQTLALMGMEKDDMDEIAAGIKLPGFIKKLEDTRAKYDENVAKMGEQKAISSMFAILGHIAAGIYGIKHGVDTSGVKFDTTDWAVEYKKAKDSYEMDRDLAETEYKSAESRRDKLSDLMRFVKSGYESKEARRVSDTMQAKMFQAGTAKTQIGQELSDLRGEKRATTQAERDEASRQFKERAALSSELAKASSAKDSTVRSNLLGDVSKKLGGMSFEEWKDEGGTPEAPRETFATFGVGDKEHYQAYVQDMLADHIKANLPATRSSGVAKSAAPVVQSSGAVKPDKMQGGVVYTWNGSKYVAK